MTDVTSKIESGRLVGWFKSGEMIMKTNQKLLMLCLAGFLIILPSCLDPVHQTTSTQPKMSVEEATAIMKKAVKGSTSDNNVKAVRDVIVDENGFTLINFDNTRKHHYFKDIVDPVVMEWMKSGGYLVKFIEPLYLSLDYVQFNVNLESANAFANALYYLKHADIKQERAKEREDSLRRARQTAAEEQKERDQKQAESLRLKQKAAMEAEAAAAKEESGPESTPEKRKSRPRPAAAKKAAGEPAPRQPEGGAPPVPTLPAGGAVSGN
jgi:hypothetical protein